MLNFVYIIWIMPSHDMMHNSSAERCPDDTLSVPYRVLTNLTDFTGVGSHILPKSPEVVTEKHRRHPKLRIPFVHNHAVSRLIKYISTLLRTSRVTALKIYSFSWTVPCHVLQAKSIYCMWDLWFLKHTMQILWISKWISWLSLHEMSGRCQGKWRIDNYHVTDPPDSR